MTNGFQLVPLRNVLRQRSEFIEIDDFKTYKRCRVQLHAQGIVERDVVQGIEIKTKKQQVCRAGEFLVAEIDAKVGGFGIVPDNLDGAIVSSHYFLFDLDEAALNRQFLEFFVRTPTFIEQVKAQGTTNYAAIRPGEVLGYKVPLPSLEEQRRIVARIEELAARIEEARGLRQEAVDETEALLGSSTVAILAAQIDVGIIPIEKLAEVRGGIQKSPDRAPGNNPVRYLTVAHVHRNYISLADPRYFEVSPLEIDRHKLKSGDVLIIEGNGSADQVGRTALFRGEVDPCVHQNHVIRIRPDQKKIDAEFLNIYLNSPLGQHEVQSRSRTTSGLRNLSVGRINQINVPVPPLAEQRRVITYLDGVQSKVNYLKQLQSETSAELDALLPSILDKAFKGEL